MSLRDKKLAVLNEVMTAFDNYQGYRKSELEKAINALGKNGTLSQEDSDKLTALIADYRQRILYALANSSRVRVNFGNQTYDKPKDNGNYPLADLDKLLDDSIFEDLGELDD